MIFTSGWAFEGDFITHSIDGKTYTDEHDELRGLQHMGRRSFQLELVREMMIIMKHQPRSYQVLPFKRALFELKNNHKPYAVFSVTRTKERENYGKWVGPLTNDITYLYELKSNPTNIVKMEDAKAYPVCILIGGFMDTPTMNKSFPFLQRSDFDSCFRMLLIKRMALVQASEHDLTGILKSVGIDRKLIRNTGVVIKKSANYMAFSNQVSDEEVQKWQSVLDSLKESKRYDELHQLYFEKE